MGGACTQSGGGSKAPQTINELHFCTLAPSPDFLENRFIEPDKTGLVPPDFDPSAAHMLYWTDMSPIMLVFCVKRIV